jgi:tRNA(Ile)-lysidine synthase
VSRAEAPLRTVERTLAGGLVPPGQRVVVAVSGGADSVFLLLALHRLAGRRGLTLEVAHLDHGWRGPAGAADAAWVAALAGDLGLPFHGGRVDARGAARAGRLSPEGAARALRYAFLRDVCRETGAAFVATGHTADDQVETILLALLRGSGPAGLGGMAEAGPLPAPESEGLRLVRPLLGVGRGAVRDALRAGGQAWREDATNLDPRLPRNRLRLDVLPRLEAVSPGWRRAIRRAGALAGQAADYLRREGQQAGERLFRPEGAALVARRRDLLALHPALRSETLRWAVAQVGGGAPEWAHLTGALATVERGRGGAVAWLAPGVRLRLERGRVALEPERSGGPGEAAPAERPHTYP